MTPACRLALPQELPFSQAVRGHVGGGDPCRVANSTGDRGVNGTSANRGLLVGQDAIFLSPARHDERGALRRGRPVRVSGTRESDPTVRPPGVGPAITHRADPAAVARAALASAGPVGGPAPEPG